MSSLLTLAMRGQTAVSQAIPTATHFDVVAIREHRSPDGGDGMSLRDGSLQVHNVLLKSLIPSAYWVREVLIFGLSGCAEVHATIFAPR